MIFMVRHGPTDWNAAGRFQGRTDIPLSEAGRKVVSGLTPHPFWTNLRCACSPLMRARETVQLLGFDNPEIAPALVETSWGKFEGLTLGEIDAEIASQEITPDSGLDLLPPDGESPRMVRERLQDWLDTIVQEESAQGRILVTHKGVIRAALSLATGWDMKQPFPESIDWRLPLAFRHNRDNSLNLESINCPWETPHA